MVFSEETPYETRYFTVWMKLDGTIESIDTGHYQFHRMEEGRQDKLQEVLLWQWQKTEWNGQIEECHRIKMKQ